MSPSTSPLTMMGAISNELKSVFRKSTMSTLFALSDSFLNTS